MCAENVTPTSGRSWKKRERTCLSPLSRNKIQTTTDLSMKMGSSTPSPHLLQVTSHQTRTSNVSWRLGAARAVTSVLNLFKHGGKRHQMLAKPSLCGYRTSYVSTMQPT